MKTLDPVCTMEVDSRTAQYHAQYQEEIYFFCSPSCKEKFEKQPSEYIEREDPVCGMKVRVTSNTLWLKHQGNVYWFCSSACREKFEKEPEKYTPQSHTCCSCHTERRTQVTPSGTAKYYCPMCPGVDQDSHGTCPKCGMALEPVMELTPGPKYTCPMHPEIVQDGPGTCPKCGMALEPMTVAPVEEDPELKMMTRRFWIALVLTLPVFFIAMFEMIPGLNQMSWLKATWVKYFQLILASPVILYCGWPFFVRMVQSFKTMNLNMFTLIGLGGKCGLWL